MWCECVREGESIMYIICCYWFQVAISLSLSLSLSPGCREWAEEKNTLCRPGLLLLGSGSVWSRENGARRTEK